MNLRRSSRDDRGVSVVVGTVLLIGMITMAMAVLGAAVLSTDLVDSPPRAEFVYQEDGNGTVAIGLTDVQKLTADGTEIKLEGEGSCGMWGSGGDLEEGAVTTVEDGDCPDSLEEGDVIQIIGAETLIDTYELRGVSGATYGADCTDEIDEKIDDGDPIVIQDGEVVECDLTDGDDRIDSPVTVRDGGELIGNISTTDEIKIDDGTVDGYVNSSKNFQLKDSSTIGGSVRLTGGGSDLTVEGGTDVGGSITTTDNDLNIVIDNTGSTIGSDITSDGSVTVKSDHNIQGSITATDDITLNDGSKVDDDVDAGDNDVTLKDTSIIQGNVTDADFVDCKGSSDVKGSINADTNC
ncbi:Type II secretory pathway component [Natrinema pellirubrum DSM 15624]|uniref:Type II secretory pathway component n=1 Tax=Natrinema pellirubrum (strain DSM 15624 / CIP 106293 / JCM 10476 / NCIMB 786 / 157) TaxID=797303 RepID=L0JR28_NATP1|nr:type IV pilin [Natrinema pellirubrum]AGB32806.1 Protein of unknown function (DUF1628) [Natrinema pellirubrum DSM 15624]ELY75568.1 Type II secretory pathway component [Natrinema pellirubrum DSM 15624]